MTIPVELRGKVTTTVAVTARVLGTGRNQTYAAVKDGTIPSIRVAGRYVVLVAPLLELLGIKSDENEEVAHANPSTSAQLGA